MSLLVLALAVPGEAARAGDGAVVDIRLGTELGASALAATVNAALATGRRVRLVSSGAGCASVAGTLNMGSHSVLEGVGDVCLSATDDRPMISVPVTSSNAALNNISFQQNGKGRVFGIVKGAGFSARAIKLDKAGALIFSGATDCLVGQASRFDEGIGAAAITLTNKTSRCVIEDSDFTSNTGFGIDLGSGAAFNRVQRNRTSQNRIELVGVRWDAHDNQILDNSARNVGDNCFSVTGDHNVVKGNDAALCRLNGLGIYGSSNLVENNRVYDAGQNHNPAWHIAFGMAERLEANASDTSPLANILVNPAFGGTGSLNIVQNNTVIDNQAETTADFGILVGAGYRKWAPTTATTARSFVILGSLILQAKNDGVSGTQAPSCSQQQPECVDGSLTWIRIRSINPLDHIPAGNCINANSVRGYRISMFRSLVERDEASPCR